MNDISFHIIATIRNDFSGKFGIPRQSGLADTLSNIIFEPKYRDPSALKGLEGFSHIWLLWYFSEGSKPNDDSWSPTVRPPRLGGNKRVGVFGTRSPNRPNRIGLSCVKLERIEQTKDGACLIVRGADLMNGTPILDIKPYLPFADSIPDALGGFAEEVKDNNLQVIDTEHLLDTLPPEKRTALTSILLQNPPPSYQKDATRIYSFEWANYKVRFSVNENTLTLRELFPLEP